MSGGPPFERSSSFDGSDADPADADAPATLARYHNILAHTPDLIFINRDNRVVYVNPPGVALLGAASAEQVLGRSPYSFFHESQHEVMRQRIAAARAHPGVFEPREYQLRRLDGQLRDVEVYAASYEVDRQVEIQVVCRDITGRRRTERALARSQALLEVASRLSRLGAWEVDLPSRTLRWSGSTHAIHELEPTDPIPSVEEAIRFYVPSDQRVIRAAFDRCVAEGVPFDEQCRMVTARGRTIWVRAMGEPIRDGDGGIVAVHGAIQDITDRKRIEREQRDAAERFNLLARATNDALWEWDIRTDALWWSEGLQHSFGFRPEDMESTLDSWTRRIHPQEVDRVVSGLHEAVQGGRTHWHDAYRFARADGDWAEVLDRGYVQRDDQGEPIRMIGGMTDVTERRQLERRLEQSRKLEAVGQLAGGVAHDFNNLLTIIRGFSEMLLAGVTTEARRAEMLNGIHDAAERAGNLTGQLLAFSRRQMLSPRVLDLNEALRDLRPMVERMLEASITLTLDLVEPPRHIRVDPAQLEQVVFNLALNARDAMPEGGTLTIRTEHMPVPEPCRGPNDPATADAYVAVHVVDTGCGMSETVRARLFEPFFTTKSAGKGTGLGLPTVLGIVEQSGGWIDVASEPNRGTRMTVLFPACDGAGAGGTDAPPPVGPDGGTVLLVEDETAVRHIARITLENHGYRVIEAGNGREALALQPADAPITADVLVTDVMMPEMDGPTLAGALRQRQADLPVVFMSGYVDHADLESTPARERAAFLQKPFSPVDLVQAVRAAALSQSTTR